MEAKPLDCPICDEDETFADQLEREMEEAEVRLPPMKCVIAKFTPTVDEHGVWQLGEGVEVE